MSAPALSLSCVHSANFDESAFLHDLVHLKDSQEHIQTLSSWCLGHTKAASRPSNIRSASDVFKIARCWSKVVSKARRPEQKLVLFYLANDLLQHASHAALAEANNSKVRKRNLLVLDKWKPVLLEVLETINKQLERDHRVREKIERVLDIWRERNVFLENKEFAVQLKNKMIFCDDQEDDEDLENPTKKSEDISFQPNSLGTQLKILKALEDDCEYKMKLVTENELSDLDAESVEKWRFTLKDRQHGADFLSDFEDGHKKLEAYIKALEKELSKRRQVIEMLNQGTKYYANLVAEANIVANAYSNFGKRVNLTRDKLQDRLPQLQSDQFSPMPSPDYDAPSPKDTDDMDLQLPDDPTKNVEMIDLVEDDVNNESNTGSNGDLTSRLDSMRGVMNADNVPQLPSQSHRTSHQDTGPHHHSSSSYDRTTRRHNSHNDVDYRRHRTPSSDYSRHEQSNRKHVDYYHGSSSREGGNNSFRGPDRNQRGSRPMNW